MTLVLGCVNAAGAPAPEASSTATTLEELPPLPVVPGLALGQPEPAEVERLESILAALVAPDEAERRGAAADVATVHAGLVAAIARRLDRVADGANRSAMKEVLLETRRLARDDARRALRESGGKGEIETPDYFEMVVAHADPTKVAWRDLVQVLAMSRMLVAIETVEAVRVLVEVYARFSFLRVDTQLQLEKLGDRAVAGLIEARRHRAAEVARWAERQLDALGRAIPGEAVQVRDPEALADVLRAYGRLRDPDAARIVVSFANSERARVREAARQAITLMGEVGTWQLRDAYENTVGKRAPRDWSWQRLARELFAAFDRQRLSQVHELYEQGRAAEARGDLRGMRRAYDMVLTRSPLFDRRGAMAAGYLAYAIRFADEDAAAAEMALDRAARIADDPAVRTRIESLRLTLRAERLRDEGIFDQELLQRAADLDATNPRPRRLLATVSNDPDAAAGARHRWIAAAVIALIAAVGAVFVTLWPRRGRPRLAGSEEGSTTPPASEPTAAKPAASNPAPSNREVETTSVPAPPSSPEREPENGRDDRGAGDPVPERIASVAELPLAPTASCPAPLPPAADDDPPPR